MEYKINNIVELVSFHGTIVPSEDVADSENYWQLIGQLGKVVKIKDVPHPAFPDKGLQVLVQFQNDLKNFNVSSHNQLENSLWIFQSDLKIK